MNISDSVRIAMRIAKKKQGDAAQFLGMSKQGFSNKMRNNSWPGRHLVDLADFMGCDLAFIFPDGHKVIIENDEPLTNEESPDA